MDQDQIKWIRIKSDGSGLNYMDQDQIKFRITSLALSPPLPRPAMKSPPMNIVLNEQFIHTNAVSGKTRF